MIFLLKDLKTFPSLFKVEVPVTALDFLDLMNLILPNFFNPRAIEPSSPLMISTLYPTFFPYSIL